MVASSRVRKVDACAILERARAEIDATSDTKRATRLDEIRARTDQVRERIEAKKGAPRGAAQGSPGRRTGFGSLNPAAGLPRSRFATCGGSDYNSRMARRNQDDVRAPRTGQTAVVEPERRTKEPRLYRVLLHNDDYTTMEFVVMVLMKVFHHPEPTALRIMLHVHQKGMGVAGVYPFEVAETRVAKVGELARANEFPLRCTMETA
jgi:ATP-dependent Clp protease adaptor protein ClpS